MLKCSLCKGGNILSKEKRKKDKETALNIWYPQKIRMAKRFIDEEEKQKGRNLLSGAVHLCKLGENIGSEQGEERPVVIISNDRINSTSTNVMIVPLTKNLKKKTVINKRTKKTMDVPRYRTHYFLKKSKYVFLTYDSAAMSEGVKTVSKIRIGQHLGEIDDRDLQAILSRLKWIFNL